MDERKISAVMSELAKRKWKKGITEEEREKRREGGRKRQIQVKKQREEARLDR